MPDSVPDTLAKDPLVSVTVITYNHEKYIAQALDSIVEQKTEYPFEILVADDASTDRTPDIIREYQEKYPHLIKAILRKNNIGARKNGIDIRSKARGKYIAYCEGDDAWNDPTKLQKQISFLEANEEYALSFHDVRVIDEYGNQTSASKLSPSQKRNLSSEEIIAGSLIPSVTVVFRKSSLDDKLLDGTEHIVNGDAIIFTLIGQYGNAKYHDDIEAALYRAHSSGVWSRKKDYDKIKDVIETRIALRSKVLPKNRDIIDRLLLDLLISKQSYMLSLPGKLFAKTFQYKWLEGKKFSEKFFLKYLKYIYPVLKKGLRK